MVGSSASARSKARSASFEILGRAEAFEDAVDVAAPRPSCASAKLGSSWMARSKCCHRRVAVFGRDRAEDEAREEVAPAQVFLVSRGALRGGPRDARLLVVRQLQSQPVNDALRDGVLHGEDVARGSINAVAPQQVAAHHVEQLGRDAEAVARVQEARGQHGVDVQLAPRVARVNRPAPDTWR